ncbi:MAG TPA: glycosyltransferase family 4 protein [Pyrinomonadaceae bacterium]|nr:glycosyltransferase family 4 protein [Pyrinomonadaceae bacterium]
MKILWMSDSPTSPSGFGNITRFVCTGLARLGHQISIIGWQKRGRAVHHRHYTVYPVGCYDSEADVLLDYLRQVRPDVLVTLADPWRVSYVASRALMRFMHSARVVWALYYPIDSDKGQGLLPSSLTNLLKEVDLPIAMSRYGRDVTRANGVTPAYIPHGIDTNLFSSSSKDKTTAKRALGYDNQFVVLSDARNQKRKLWPRTLEIFRRFAAGKDDVRLHLHCDPYDPSAGSKEYCYDLLADVDFLGLSEKVRFTRGMSITRGISLARLATLYRAADVHLLSSYGEGFGLPTLQAAAAGAVPMAPAYSANRELVRGHGEAVRVRHFVRDQSNMRCALIDIDDAVRRLERLYHDRALLESKSKAARRFAESYSWERIVPQWHDLLQREVPRLRASRSRRRATSRRFSIRSPRRYVACGAAHKRHDGRQRLPDELQRRIKELERKGQYLTADIVRDVSNFGSPFTIPVTLPPVDPLLAQVRVTGRVYLASRSDLATFQELTRIFPGLSAWSAVELKFGSRSRRAFRCTTVPANSPEFPGFLATSTLALDLGGLEPSLPLRAAELAVPLIGLSLHKDQRWLWPDLTLEKPDLRTAVEKGRWMLADQGDAAKACALASKRRRSSVQPRSSKPSNRSLAGVAESDHAAVDYHSRIRTPSFDRI